MPCYRKNFSSLLFQLSLYLCVICSPVLAAEVAPDQLPLHTQRASIVDAKGNPLQLVSVNWFGFDEGEYVVGGLDRAPLEELAHRIRTMGFNSVRLPWANQVMEANPVVPTYALNANPGLRGKHAMEIMDAVIDALAKEHLMIILDNHVSRADWCCNDKDGNGLWYNREYPESAWLADWQTIVRRYANQPYVIGADLRNELRSGARWGGADASVDWHGGAERGGNAVLAANPKLLIFVEGINYSLKFDEVGKLPVHLNIPARLVYSPHNYPWSQDVPQSYEELKTKLDKDWGYLQKGPDATPLWMGEIGICQNLSDCRNYGNWFQWLVRYIKENNLSWAYWTLNGTQSSGAGRLYGATEGYGLLSIDYKHVAAPDVLTQLEAVGLSPAHTPAQP